MLMSNIEKKIKGILVAARTEPLVVMLKAQLRRLDIQQLDIIMGLKKTLIPQKESGISDHIFYAQSLDFYVDKAMKEKVASEMEKMLKNSRPVSFPLNTNTSRHVIDWLISRKELSKDMKGLFSTEQWSELKKDRRFRDYLSKSS